MQALLPTESSHWSSVHVQRTFSHALGFAIRNGRFIEMTLIKNAVLLSGGGGARL